MDTLQLALVFLIILMAIILTAIGLQVFFLLRDLKRAVDRVGDILEGAQNLAESIGKPVKAMTNLAAVVETGIKVAQSFTSKMGEKKKKAPALPEKV